MPNLQRKQQKETPMPERGARLLEVRKLFNMSQEQLANWLYEDETPLTQPQSAASQWETGRRPMPYEKIATKLGISVDWLLGFSPEMWGGRVLALRRVLRSYLASLPADRQAYVQSPARDPADRVRMVVEFLQVTEPSLMTRRYLAALILHGDAATLDEILRGDAYADGRVYKKLASFASLPSAWFEFGDNALIQDGSTEPYRGAITECIAKGITPDRLSKLVAAI